MWFIFLLLLILFEIIADVFVKEHSIKKTYLTFFAALSFYITANICWLISMRYKSNLTIGANIFSVCTGLTAALIGVGLYNEQLTPLNYLGVLLGFISLLLLFHS
jgi:multidrug transporter EmrE-like cation transporter